MDQTIKNQHWDYCYGASIHKENVTTFGRIQFA